MIKTANEQLIEHLQNNLFNEIKEATQSDLENISDQSRIHGISLSLPVFSKNELVKRCGDNLIQLTHHIMNENLKSNNFDLLVIQIYDYKQVKKCFYLKAVTLYEISTESRWANLPNTEKSEFDEFRSIPFGMLNIGK